MPDQPPTSPHIFTYLDARVPVRCHEHLAIVHRGEARVPGARNLCARGCAGAIGVVALRPPHCTRHARAPPRTRLSTCSGIWTSDAAIPAEARTPAICWIGRGFFAEAENAQAPAVRWLEEGVWAKPAGISVPQFFELHARLNYLVKQYPSVACASTTSTPGNTSPFFRHCRAPPPVGGRYAGSG